MTAGRGGLYPAPAGVASSLRWRGTIEPTACDRGVKLPALQDCSTCRTEKRLPLARPNRARVADVSAYAAWGAEVDARFPWPRTLALRALAPSGTGL